MQKAVAHFGNGDCFCVVLEEKEGFIKIAQYEVAL